MKVIQFSSSTLAEWDGCHGPVDILRILTDDGQIWERCIGSNYTDGSWCRVTLPSDEQPKPEVPFAEQPLPEAQSLKGTPTDTDRIDFMERTGRAWVERLWQTDVAWSETISGAPSAHSRDAESFTFGTLRESVDAAMAGEPGAMATVAPPVTTFTDTEPDEPVVTEIAQPAAKIATNDDEQEVWF